MNLKCLFQHYIKRAPLETTQKENVENLKQKNAKLKTLEKQLGSLSQRPTGVTTADLKKSIAAETKARQKPRQARSRIRKDLEHLVELTVIPLLKPYDEPALSAKERLEAAFNTIKNNPSLLVDNAAEIVTLLKNPALKKAAIKYRNALKQALRSGVLRATKDGSVQLHSVRKGAKPVAQRLTNYELQQIYKVNLQLLSQLIYPKILNCSPTTNFVDKRLGGTRKAREVFAYDPTGRLVGWTRWQDNKKESFTKDGYLIKKTDAQGRAILAREVNYITVIEYREGAGNRRLAGTVTVDKEGVIVKNAEGKVLVSRENGRGVNPAWVQFLVLAPPAEGTPPEGKGGYVVDLNHFTKQRVQTGWTRYAGERVIEFTPNGGGKNSFSGRLPDGSVVPNRKLLRQVPPVNTLIRGIPGKRLFRYEYASPEDRIGKAQVMNTKEDGSHNHKD